MLMIDGLKFNIYLEIVTPQDLIPLCLLMFDKDMANLILNVTILAQLTLVVPLIPSWFAGTFKTKT